MNELEKKKEDAIWVARSLFERGKATGSSANLSFLHEGNIYITASGTCFGRLTADDFSEVTMDLDHRSGKKPSKELPLHQMCYKKSDEIQAVVHIHSFYATLFSCGKREPMQGSIIPDHTPYLRMKVGTVGLVPYAKPGSRELFEQFEQEVNQYDAWLLAHHGPVVAGKTMMDAFYGMEELEESCHIALELEKMK